MLHKGLFQKMCHCPNELIGNLFHNRQKKWQDDAGYKFEERKCLYPISALQNRKPTSYKRYFAAMGFHMENRSERCIFFSYHKHKSQEILPSCVGGQFIRAPLPMFWSWLSYAVVNIIFKKLQNVVIINNYQYLLVTRSRT